MDCPWFYKVYIYRLYRELEPLRYKSEFFTDNPSGRTLAPGFTQPLTEMSTRNISWR